MKRTIKQLAAIGMSVAISLSMLAGCGSAFSSGQESSDDSSSSVTKKSGKLNLVFLQKQGDQQYFVDEANGAKAKAKELGNVDVTVVNLGTDSNKAISELQSALSRGVDGVIMVAPDQSIGPRVVQATTEAKVPLLAADDILKDSSGKEVPFVGFDGTAMGNAIGKEAAKLYNKAGWKSADSRIIAVGKQDLSVCVQRTDGAKDAFTKAVSDSPKIIDLGNDNSSSDALNKAGGVISANQTVKNWVVWGCNDESETGVVTALQNAGVSGDNIIGVGLGGYLTCKDWRAGKNTGNKAALYNSGTDVGSDAVRVMTESLRNGTELPANTIVKVSIIDATNWEKSGVVCS
jgi:L-arabinose transport system substrate-binding protein